MADDSLVGVTLLGRYRVDRRIGLGGMGRVYAGEHLRLGVPVAIKVLGEHLAHDAEYRQRFLRETRLVASLRHPNIIHVYDADEAPEALFLVTQLVHGSDLRELIRNEGRLEPSRALDVITQMAAALDAAHSTGLVHRDVKPANVLVEGTHAYLADFGLARPVEGSNALTQTAQFLGTLSYAAPEQFEGGPIGPETDIYALGCVLYEVLCGTPPFQGATDVALMRAHLDGTPPAPSHARPELGRAIDAVVAKAMAKDPSARHASAGALAASAREAILGADAPPRRQRPREQHGTRTRMLALGLAVVVGVVVSFLVGSALLKPDARTATGHGATRFVRRAPATRSVGVAPAALEVPTSFHDRPSSRAIGVPARNLRDDDGSQLLVATTHAAGPSLLPTPLARLASARTVVSIGSKGSAIRAYLYPDLRVGTTPAVGYVVPTSRGSVTAICVGETPDALSRCRTIVRTLRVGDAHVFPPGDPATIARVRARLVSLQRRVATDSSVLEGASAPTAQSSAATRLATSFAATARDLPDTNVSPELVTRVAAVRSGLRTVERAMTQLAAAAATQDSQAFSRASMAAASGQRALARSIAALSRST